MQQSRVILIGFIAVAVVAVIAAIAATSAGAGTQRYALKVRVTEKNATDNFFVGHILDQTSGKTNIKGDLIVFRAMSGAAYYNKSGKKNSRKLWMSNLKADPQTGDIVSVVGLYKSSDKTFEVSTKAVNRSR